MCGCRSCTEGRLLLLPQQGRLQTSAEQSPKPIASLPCSEGFLLPALPVGRGWHLVSVSTTISTYGATRLLNASTFAPVQQPVWWQCFEAPSTALLLQTVRRDGSPSLAISLSAAI